MGKRHEDDVVSPMGGSVNSGEPQVCCELAWSRWSRPFDRDSGKPKRAERTSGTDTDHKRWLAVSFNNSAGSHCVRAWHRSTLLQTCNAFKTSTYFKTSNAFITLRATYLGLPTITLHVQMAG